MKKKAIKWYGVLKPEHIDAAIDYLSLFFDKARLKVIKKKITENQKNLISYKAKDILRASGFAPLSPNDSEIVDQLKRIRNGLPLHPIILVTVNSKLYIADGFHRVCACYSLDDATEVTGAHISL